MDLGLDAPRDRKGETGRVMSIWRYIYALHSVLLGLLVAGPSVGLPRVARKAGHRQQVIHVPRGKSIISLQRSGGISTSSSLLESWLVHRAWHTVVKGCMDGMRRVQELFHSF